MDVLCSAMNGVPYLHPVVCTFRINSYFLSEKNVEIFIQAGMQLDTDLYLFQCVYGVTDSE